MSKYEALDNPAILQYLFHPRKEGPHRSAAPGREDFMIPVAEGISLGASLHYSDPGAPVVLFFHGNGEIVSDYDELGQAFTRGAGVNFFVADYRGYGASSGSPSASAMISDAHRVLEFVQEMMGEKKMTGSLTVMGRSLGSAPALELAARSSFEFHALIIESGFALAGPLLRVLGLNPERFGFDGLPGEENLDKMAGVTSPCLVIHAQFDHLIPFSDGQALFDACPAEKKHLLEIKGANHNDIFIRGMAPYLEQVRNFCRG
ncbi:MAG: alpha/beta hydrolase [Desulfobacterales bacterium]|nr:alpha/beta hydrolase [Desulfobacterales bacterium]